MMNSYVWKRRSVFFVWLSMSTVMHGMKKSAPTIHQIGDFEGILGLRNKKFVLKDAQDFLGNNAFVDFKLRPESLEFDKNYDSFLYKLCEKQDDKHLDAIKFLVEKDWDVNEKNKDLFTPLHAALLGKGVFKKFDPAEDIIFYLILKAKTKADLTIQGKPFTIVFPTQGTKEDKKFKKELKFYGDLSQLQNSLDFDTDASPRAIIDRLADIGFSEARWIKDILDNDLACSVLKNDLTDVQSRLQALNLSTSPESEPKIKFYKSDGGEYDKSLLDILGIHEDLYDDIEPMAKALIDGGIKDPDIEEKLQKTEWPKAFYIKPWMFNQGYDFKYYLDKHHPGFDINEVYSQSGVAQNISVIFFHALFKAYKNEEKINLDFINSLIELGANTSLKMILEIDFYGFISLGEYTLGSLGLSMVKNIDGIIQAKIKAMEKVAKRVVTKENYSDDIKFNFELLNNYRDFLQLVDPGALQAYDEAQAAQENPTFSLMQALNNGLKTLQASLLNLTQKLSALLNP